MVENKSARNLRESIELILDDLDIVVIPTHCQSPKETPWVRQRVNPKGKLSVNTSQTLWGDVVARASHPLQESFLSFFFLSFQRGKGDLTQNQEGMHPRKPARGNLEERKGRKGRKRIRRSFMLTFTFSQRTFLCELRLFFSF